MPGSAGSGEGAFSCADTEPIIFLLSRRIDPAARPPTARAGASPGPAISPTGTARGKCAAPRSF